MEIIRRILSAIKGESPLQEAIKLGVRPEEIKEAVIETLNPYFGNKAILEKYSIDMLIPEFVGLLKLKQDELLFNLFERCYLIYREAKNINKELSLKSCAFYHSNIIDSISKFWSICRLEIDKDVLESEERVFECFRNIGDIIEGLAKPYLKTLLCQLRILLEKKR